MSPLPPGGYAPAGVNMNNSFVRDTYARASSTREARTALAATCMLANGDGSIESSAALGPNNERAFYVTPRCSDRWVARFAVRRLTFSDYHGRVDDTLRDGGFRRLECTRALQLGEEVVGLDL